MKKQAIVVLRWLAVLPASFLGSMLASLFFNLAWHREWGEWKLMADLRDTTDFGGRWVLGPWYLGFLSVIGCYSFVVAGALTAPTHRRETGFVLAGALSTLFLIVGGLHLFGGIRDPEASAAGVIVRCLVTYLVGGIAAFFAAASFPLNENTEFKQ